MTVIIDARSREAIAAAVNALSRGDCVAMPTETVYGLAADATSGLAVARIFEMKGRPRFNPLIAHVADIAMARAAGRFEAIAERLAEAFWPGPLTLVVARTENSAIHDLATAGLDTVGLRMPRGFAREAIAAFGRPLAAPSANRSGRVSPTDAGHVAEEFAGTDLLVIDGGPCPVGIESTIVRVEAGRLVLLRPGTVTAGELSEAGGLPVESPGRREGISAPGMLASHYAPRAMLRLGVTKCPAGAALLAFGPGPGRDRGAAAAVLNLSESADLREAAANLYHHLKALNSAGVALICAEPVPAAGIGAAINDRLTRAAAPRKVA